ncbi:methylated-DNA--[protein]-cysteine S-methyltransferase [Fervidibacillus albus]|uniref:Methylated-DNA--protein-cysteine methyltransferase n=1 Tax=Fervidibacillus albus TaxID=2980026 RepID=A0A9E8RXG2_9BACI|nr:methylated-DNA--[protein]-cysteine S-methyltransferase [Fervidibacillus albus]WAA11133.1 methylated-DNA--[protein]-cysteine S-methyltransferase [Fervidibacillus albus]
MSYSYLSISTIIGPLSLVADQQTVRRLFFSEKKMFEWAKGTSMINNPNHPILRLGKEQIEEYFSGRRKQFQIPYTIEEGTDFQRSVWHALSTIPYGETVSYGQIAKLIGNEKAVRAVGQANRKNPLPILIPCHRVIGKNGGLVGYDGNRINIKEQLLSLEKNCTFG